MTGIVVRIERHGAVMSLLLDHPPVNSLCHATRRALWDALLEADADPAVDTIVLAGSGRGFSAGGDFDEMRLPAQQAWPALSDHLFGRIENCTKPVVAALHGFAVGGGLELALACHHRVARRDTRIALPELKHGVVPPSGSQRLPRAVGVARALDLIVSAQSVVAQRYADTLLFDRLCDGDVLRTALAFAATLDRRREPAAALLRHRPLDRVRGLEAVARARAQLIRMPAATEALAACIDAVEFAVTAPHFDDGLVQAKRLHDDLRARISAG